MRKIRNGFQQIMIRRILFSIFCVIFISSSWAKIKAPASSQVTLTDAQKPILIKRPNQTFTIILKSNPTTGYIWVLNQFDSQNITPIKRTYYAPDSNLKDQVLVGTSGYEEWRFQLNQSGMVVPRLMNITFCMMRPWTINCDIKKTFTVIYVV